ncbi:dihydrofolate reductase family protein [Kitasatospora kifunensis]|uniref:Dihydrofolate reductase n=1 Tax=Kitasatospora kifunensis TaxID=58351 RepID=A0A7W7RB22_KITKI|nr:dihydrofolate reductase family protein [Kitasatospora kifunensis]MBB4928668.1 hypothetical protein [Kitasatospora kifunensis]
MHSVTYSLGVSLDGYIVGPGGGFDWTPPDEEVFRFAADEVREAGVHLLGRRLYETMLYWESVDQNPSPDFSTLEFAAVWKALPKVVFSTTLSAVQGNARLASCGLVEEIERLRAEPPPMACPPGREGVHRRRDRHPCPCSLPQGPLGEGSGHRHPHDERPDQTRPSPRRTHRRRTQGTLAHFEAHQPQPPHGSVILPALPWSSTTTGGDLH